MNQIKAEVLARSINPQGDELITYLLVYPRFIHSELMTHRMFSRNSASSRAIPFGRMVKMVEEDPFIPIAWQKQHTGMQGTEYFTDSDNVEGCKHEWLKARDYAVEQASVLNEDLGEGGVTKQLCNRLLEPFMWHTVLVTTSVTEESLLNFFELRCPKFDYLGQKLYKSRKDAIKETNASLPYDDWYSWQKMNKSQAEIHIQALAEAMWDARNMSTPKHLEEGQWHIPFGYKLLNIPDFDYTKTQERDLEFHKHRIMFIVKDEKVITAPQGIYKSHTEYFGDITGLIRGFRWNNEVYTYIDKFIPIESEIVAKYFDRLTCYAGAKDFFHYKYGENPIIKIATARCARLSYNNHNGEIDYQKDIELHDRLLASHHMSPMEHSAMCKNDSIWYANFKGFISYRYLIENNYDLQNFV